MSGLRSCFARTQTWLQAGKYVNAVASDLPSRNGWSVAEYAGDRTPDRMQRLLNRASWDEMVAMSQVRRYAVAGLDAAARRRGGRLLAVGALDETGQEKQGSCTSGVKRQYMGCAGRVANGINTVHLSYVREKTGHALIGAAQWIPAEQVRDPVKALVTGLPPDLVFRTKDSWPSASSRMLTLTGCRWMPCAEMRCTGTARSCVSSWKAAVRRTCCGSRRRS